MPLLKVEAEKLSQNTLVSGVIEEIIDKDDLFSVLPFMGVEGKSYDYVRENTLSEGEFISPVTGTVPEGAAEFQEVSTKLKVLAGDVDVDKFLMTTMSDTNPQLSEQIAAKAKGIGRKFRRTLAIGDEAVDSLGFNGVGALCAADQKIVAGTDGAALDFSMLDELLDAVPNGADVIMMRSGAIRAYRALLRASGGLEPAHVMMEDFGRPMLTHNGVPIIVNDFLPDNETQGANTATTSIYAMRLNTADGLHGIFGGNSAGVQFEEVGTVQDKDAFRYRLKWYAGTALKSTKSLAAIKGITNV